MLCSRPRLAPVSPDDTITAVIRPTLNHACFSTFRFLPAIDEAKAKRCAVSSLWRHEPFPNKFADQPSNGLLPIACPVPPTITATWVLGVSSFFTTPTACNSSFAGR